MSGVCGVRPGGDGRAGERDEDEAGRAAAPLQGEATRAGPLAAPAPRSVSHPAIRGCYSIECYCIYFLVSDFIVFFWHFIAHYCSFLYSIVFYCILIYNCVR